MTQARPLRDLFDELAGARPAGAGPADALAGGGHGDLPDQLVAEAIVSYADTAPVEVAAHLAPFVTAHSAVPQDPGAAVPDPATGLDLLATAPTAVPPDDPFPAGEVGPAGEPPAGGPADAGAPGSLERDHGTDFGAGDLSGGEPDGGALAGTVPDDDPFGLDFGDGGQLPGEPVVDQPEPLDAYPDGPEPVDLSAPAPPEPADPEPPAGPDGGLAG